MPTKRKPRMPRKKRQAFIAKMLDRHLPKLILPHPKEAARG